MDFAFDAAQRAARANFPLVLAVFLLAIRLGLVFALTPVLQAVGVPLLARIAFVIGLAFALALGLDRTLLPSAEALSGAALLAAVGTEAALGATLALGVLCAFAAISMAGRMIDVQAGFGLAQVFDPVTRRQVPVVQGAFDKLGVVAFFLLDGHHALVRGIAFSLGRFPLGRAWPIEAAAPVVMTQLAALFGLGFALAAPVVFCLLAVELAIGVLSRNMPQMNLFVIGVPAKVAVAMAVLAIWLGSAGDAMNRIYASIGHSWNEILSEGAR